MLLGMADIGPINAREHLMSVARPIIEVELRKEIMSKQTTSLLSVGPLTTGPFGDVEPWRVSSQSQLVEGGIPYWLVTPTQPAEHVIGTDVLVVEFPDAKAVVASVLMLVATWHGGESVLGYLMDTENVRLDGKVRSIAPYWELSEDGVRHLSNKLKGQVKLAFTIMDDLCLVDDEVIGALRSLGFHVDVFVRERALTSASS